jgi:2'-5' RNA ligase
MELFNKYFKMTKIDTYLLTITPPVDVIKAVDKYIKKYAKYTQYIIPPHITIYPPFLLKDIKEEELIKILNGTLNSSTPFKIVLNSVSYFEGESR